MLQLMTAGKKNDVGLILSGIGWMLAAGKPADRNVRATWHKRTLTLESLGIPHPLV